MTTIALLAAIHQEASPTLSALGLKRVGDQWRGQSPAGASIVAAITGIGRDRVAQTLDRLLETQRPKHLINFGFAGGLDPSLPVGGILTVTRLSHSSGDTLELLPDAPPRLVDRPAAGSGGRGAPAGGGATLITVDTLIDSPADKRKLFTQTGAMGVDMETYHLANLARERGLIFHAIRVISDPADFALPADAARWITPAGGVSALGLARSLLLRPTIIPTLVKLGRHAAIANDALGRAVVRLTHSLD